MSHAPGSLVRARGREWVVLPGSTDELLLVRPLGGSEEDRAGILTALEQVEPAHFGWPSPDQRGSHLSARLLRDAVRLGFRASAGPFRSFGNLAFEPRPYQLVPLLMALRLDPVRMLIADDVGIGKTVESLLIARELLDRGEIRRTCVLCPPHLAEQWQQEMAEKFHVEAVPVLSGTVRRLERNLLVSESLFDRYPHVVVSIDFIKADRRRDDFLRAAPEFVIVDEAHGCAFAGEAGRARHQRHQLVRSLADDPSRHLVLVTATPHSGKDEAFRSLLGLLDPEFREWPTDLSGEENRQRRERLARHVVLRRRADLADYLDEKTPFPEREDKEVTYRLDENWKRLFGRVIDHLRETVPAGGEEEPETRQRFRWWAAIGVLRALASSPPAAAATMRQRARLDDEDEEAAAERFRAEVLDAAADTDAEASDLPLAGDVEGGPGDDARRARLLALAREVEKLAGRKRDPKLDAAVRQVGDLVRQDRHPIVFCRFVQTVHYLVDHLHGALGDGVAVEGVTGELTPAEREQKVEDLGKAPRRVLVATDCLSEGINLQEHFDAVFHYDLSWSPTRHEQREGRVDRFGQKRKQVTTVLFWGKDNGVDGIVLEVLLRKHRAIRRALGISVPVPAGSDQVLNAVLEGVLLRRAAGGGRQLLLPGLPEELRPRAGALHGEWDRAAERERRSRSLFAQHAVDREEVRRELAASREAIGGAPEVRRFVTETVRLAGGVVRPEGETVLLDFRETPRELRELLGEDHRRFPARFAPPARGDERVLVRTHPLVRTLAGWVLDTALEDAPGAIARRAAVIRTRAVEWRTGLFLLRLRYHLAPPGGGTPLLAEEAALLAFRDEGGGDRRRLDPGEAEALLAAEPAENVPETLARRSLEAFVGEEARRKLVPLLEEEAARRARALAEAHRRVQRAGRRGPARDRLAVAVRPVLPVDVLAVAVLLPAPGGGR